MLIVNMKMKDPEDYYEWIRSNYDGKIIIKDTLVSREIAERRSDLKLTIKGQENEIDEIVLMACKK